MAADWKMLLTQLRGVGLDVFYVNHDTGEVRLMVPGVMR